MPVSMKGPTHPGSHTSSQPIELHQQACDTQTSRLAAVLITVCPIWEKAFTTDHTSIT